MQNIRRDTHHFNSRPHEEADDKKEELDEQQNYFNSRPHEEADHL